MRYLLKLDAQALLTIGLFVVPTIVLALSIGLLSSQASLFQGIRDRQAAALGRPGTDPVVAVPAEVGALAGVPV